MLDELLAPVSLLLCSVLVVVASLYPALPSATAICRFVLSDSTRLCAPSTVLTSVPADQATEVGVSAVAEVSMVVTDAPPSTVLWVVVLALVSPASDSRTPVLMVLVVTVASEARPRRASISLIFWSVAPGSVSSNRSASAALTTFNCAACALTSSA